MATIYDVARKAGVSTGTVSRYLTGKGYVGEAARERIQYAIQELDFSPSGIARGLSKKHTRMIGFVVSDLLNPFVPEVVRGAQDLADESEYCMLIYNTDGNGQREVRALQLLYERRVDGLIIMPPETPEGNAFILELHRRGIPLVLIGRSLDSVAVDRVTTDTYTGALAVVQHLAALGHQRIAFIAGESALRTTRGRYQGYLDGLARAGLSFDASLLVEAPLTHDGGAHATAQLLQLTHPPTGIFTINDMVALGAMQEIYRQGLSIPNDISLVGFDDIALAALVQPPLTTVAQPKHLLGQTAVEQLLAQIEHAEDHHPQEIRLPCSIVVRNSTAPVAAKKR